MAWFRRRTSTGGRHALGAAVTSIPSGPPVIARPKDAAAGDVAPPAPAGAPEEDLYGSISALLSSGGAWSAPEASSDVVQAAPTAAPATTVPLRPGTAPPASDAALRVAAPTVRIVVTEAVRPPGAAPAAPATDAPPPSVLAERMPVAPPSDVPLAQPLAGSVVAAAPAAATTVAPPARPASTVLSGQPGGPAVGPVAAPAATPAAGSAPPTARSSFAQARELLPTQGAAAPQQLRVQLGFRDGTSTTLDPGSSQARALEELAQSLTRRD